MTTDTLVCKCGIEVRIVRLNPQTTALGHVRNPRNGSHYVSLARAAADSSSRATAPGLTEDIRPQHGERDMTRRGGANLHERTAASLRSSASQPSEGRASTSGVPLTARPPRVPQSAARRS